MRPSPPARACARAFPTAFTVLFTRILAQRRVSAKLLNSSAFLAIFLTTLGLSVYLLVGVLLPGARDEVRLVRGGVSAGAPAIRERVGPGPA